MENVYFDASIYRLPGNAQRVFPRFDFSLISRSE